MSFFSCKFFFGGQEFAGKQDKWYCGSTAYIAGGRWKMNLLAAKIYYDGSNWIAIPHKERPYRQRRRRPQTDKSTKVQQFEKRFEKVKGGRKSRKAKLLLCLCPACRKAAGNTAQSRWRRHPRDGYPYSGIPSAQKWDDGQCRLLHFPQNR